MNNSRRIGQCIYCGSVEKKLSREHVVPYALNGEWTLLDASCEVCAAITSTFERHALRDIFLSARSFYGLRSRSGNLPETTPITAMVDGKETILEYPIKKFGSLICLLEYPFPAYIDGREYTQGVTVTGTSLISTKGNTLEDIGKYLGVNQLSFHVSFNATQFERFIAKIAYGFSVLNYGLEKFDEIYVLPAIRGEKDDIGMWFGSKEIRRGTADLDITLREFKGDVIAEARLFGALPVPTYLVVVGKVVK